ncbi:hypothetical protein Acor_19020 [Acrocarpospora corrugata]|uniref:Uncharacterized protein n=1 Tax=Acrocarpospora corrugata TaxID=35763 RepID=A0A5M3VUE4_9ACTN|nr:hypothetical protein Acor_19020 [Acrocarpospora corrugata]
MPPAEKRDRGRFRECARGEPAPIPGPGRAARLTRDPVSRSPPVYSQPEFAAIRTASTRLRAPVLHMIRDR